MRISFIILFCFFELVANTQHRVLVYFKDKGPEAFEKLKHPELLYTPEAIERRIQSNCNFDLLDVPVNPEYIALIARNGYKIQSVSRWLNAVMIEASAEKTPDLLRLPIVEKIQFWDEYNSTPHNTTATQSIYNYGNSTNQIKMLNLDLLHNQGYTGNQILVMVCDGGFNNVNNLGAFQYMRSKNRIKATRDFVSNDGDVYADDNHGAFVLSILAAKLDSGVIGSGFDANFMLARTENVASETHSEEYNWLLASEWADSAGVKIIQSSLGYSDFDSGGNYAPTAMDGHTAIITQAAVIATRKGMVIVNSAGNEGDKNFRKITAPSDADSILCVGSVYDSKARVMNSGQGPSADLRIKPDVMAMGGNTAYVNGSNTVSFGTGTSFASPLIAGLCACLMQKNKYVTNIELVNAVKRSADRFGNPDTLYGYGIPNAFIADTILQNISSGRGIERIVKSNPNIIINSLASNELKLNISIQRPIVIEIYNCAGKVICSKEIITNHIDISTLQSGTYYLKLNGQFAGKFCKL